MAKVKDGDAVIIKKYANRRLYNTQSSSYITLDHLAQMVREGVDFKVVDAKTGDDLTRSILLQIILEDILRCFKESQELQSFCDVCATLADHPLLPFDDLTSFGNMVTGKDDTFGIMRHWWLLLQAGARLVSQSPVPAGRVPLPVMTRSYSVSRIRTLSNSSRSILNGGSRAGALRLGARW